MEEKREDSQKSLESETDLNFFQVTEEKQLLTSIVRNTQGGRDIRYH